jgi:membrane protein DedA with SNARE-associated domain
VIPFLAGTVRLGYGRFLTYNIIGAVTWGIGSVLLGFLAGNSYQQIEKALGPATATVVGIVVVVAVIAWTVRRHRSERRKDSVGQDDSDESDDSDDSAADDHVAAPDRRVSD